MNADQAKRLLRVFVDGKKLDTIAVRELYLSGYIGIELHSARKEPVPTTITEKANGYWKAKTSPGTSCPVQCPVLMPAGLRTLTT